MTFDEGLAVLEKIRAFVPACIGSIIAANVTPLQKAGLPSINKSVAALIGGSVGYYGGGAIVEYFRIKGTMVPLAIYLVLAVFGVAILLEAMGAIPALIKVVTDRVKLKINGGDGDDRL